MIKYTYAIIYFLRVYFITYLFIDCRTTYEEDFKMFSTNNLSQSVHICSCLKVIYIASRDFSKTTIFARMANGWSICTVITWHWVGWRKLGSWVFGLLLPSASPSSLIWISLRSPNPMEKSSWVWNLCLTLLGQRCLCSEWQSSNKKTPNFKYYQLFTNNFILKETRPAVWQPHCKALFEFSPWSSIPSIQRSGASESHSNVCLLIPGLFLRPTSSAKAGLRSLHGSGPVGADPSSYGEGCFPDDAGSTGSVASVRSGWGVTCAFVMSSPGHVHEPRRWRTAPGADKRTNVERSALICQWLVCYCGEGQANKWHRFRVRDGGNHVNGGLNAITPQPKKGSQWYFNDLNSEPWLSLEFSRSQLLKYTSAWALLQTS